MPRLTPEEVEEFLAGPHLAVLSVSRQVKGPIAVPVWYDWDGTAFRVITFPDSVHGRLIQAIGRATITCHEERYGEDDSLERYVVAEGPTEFTEEQIEPVVMRIRDRYYRNARRREWVERPLAGMTTSQRVATLTPERMSGFEWADAL